MKEEKKVVPNPHIQTWDSSVVEHYHRVVATLVAQRWRPGDTVIDLGCGLGQTASLMLDAHPGMELDIADAYVDCLDVTSQRAAVSRTFLLKKDAYDFSVIGKKYKFVIMSHVLEHMRDPVRVLQSAIELVKGDGVCIVAVPNPARPSVLLSNLSKKHYVNRGHVVAWDRSHFINFLENIMKWTPLFGQLGGRFKVDSRFIIRPPLPVSTPPTAYGHRQTASGVAPGCSI